MRAKTVSAKRRAGMRKGNGQKTFRSDHANTYDNPMDYRSKPNHAERTFNRFVTDRVTIKANGAVREVPYEPKFISDTFGNRMRNPYWSGA